MSKEEKFEYFFFHYIYQKLSLDKIEDYFEKHGIKSYDGEVTISNLRFAKYFSLLNRGSIESFSEESRKEFNQLFELEAAQILSNKEIYNKTINFVVSHFKQFFFSKSGTGYKYYGGVDYNYMAPADAITFGFNYCKYTNNDGINSEEVIDEKEAIINDILNKIQEDISIKNNLKLAVIKYDELFLSDSMSKI